MSAAYVEEIARQLHFMKPAHLAPREHVFMRQRDERTLRVLVEAPDRQRRCADITYNAGADDYTVRYAVAGEPARTLRGVYCDMLGELVFGDDAVPFEPVVVISD